MNSILKKIIDQKIEKIVYSELNNPERAFYYKGFDTFDYAINIKTNGGYWFHIAWKDDDFFEIGEEEYYCNKHLNLKEIKSWEATKRWEEVLNKKVTDFQMKFVDESSIILKEVKIEFESKKNIHIVIGKELNTDESIPSPLTYEFNGHIYVFHDEVLYNKLV